MSKYKVGDKVRIVSKWNNKSMENLEGLMDKWLGQIMTIDECGKNVRGDSYYRMKEHNHEWAWNDYCIEGLADECTQTITITADKITLSGGNILCKAEILPKRYIINKNATILFWNDGTKTVVKKSKDDAYDIAKGFLWAYFLKTSGMSRTKANKYIENIVKEKLEEEVK